MVPHHPDRAAAQRRAGHLSRLAFFQGPGQDHPRHRRQLGPVQGDPAHAGRCVGCRVGGSAPLCVRRYDGETLLQAARRDRPGQRQRRRGHRDRARPSSQQGCPPQLRRDHARTEGKARAAAAASTLRRLGPRRPCLPASADLGQPRRLVRRGSPRIRGRAQQRGRDPGNRTARPYGAARRSPRQRARCPFLHRRRGAVGRRRDAATAAAPALYPRSYRRRRRRRRHGRDQRHVAPAAAPFAIRLVQLHLSLPLVRPVAHTAAAPPGALLAPQPTYLLGADSPGAAHRPAAAADSRTNAPDRPTHFTRG
mmetsp:Transcript_5896/g.18769  ORF Transcript_5896/g.18769 Transcript_5896/m.18769 type:complete len:309 (+) Transcript_5896:1016-1942(+)